MKRKKISVNVIRRLPRYLRKLDELTEKGVARISSSELGAELGLTPSQIRQDFSNFGEFGQQGYGYNVTALRAEIAGILGINGGYKAILVGVGNIGRALIENFDFAEWGVSVLGAFDVKESLVGTSINGVPIYDASEAPKFLEENDVDIVVLCVSKANAKKVAADFISSGIEAIWNFTNVDIVEPDSSIIVENMHFSDSMLVLSYNITARRADAAERAAKGLNNPNR